jgi:tRNA pseudouridine38-40 synthase
MLRIEIEADRFLYKMARNLVGTIVQMGNGKLGGSVLDLIASRDRTKAGMTAPAHGLSLINVFYGNAL